MISQSLYFNLVGGLFWAGQKSVMRFTEEMKSFIKPYVLVIHLLSGSTWGRRGFYLDREYRHIIDVKDCQEPENSVKIARYRLPVTGDLPAWVLEELDATDDSSCYDSFWLYGHVGNPLSYRRDI